MTIRLPRPSSLSPAQQATLHARKKQVRDCLRRLDPQGAVESQKVVLSLTSLRWGAYHLKTVAALYDLGSCHLKNHQTASALAQYKAAFDIASRQYPEMTAVLHEIRSQIIICEILSEYPRHGSIINITNAK